MKWNDEWVLQQPSLVKKDLAGTKRLLLFSLRPPEGSRVPLLCALNLLHLNLCWRTAERRRTDVKLRYGSNFKHIAPLFFVIFISRRMQDWDLFLTHVVVPRDCHGCSGSGALLGEVVAKSQNTGVVLQHGGNFHLHRVAQFLPLQPAGE